MPSLTCPLSLAYDAAVPAASSPLVTSPREDYHLLHQSNDGQQTSFRTRNRPDHDTMTVTWKRRPPRWKPARSSSTGLYTTSSDRSLASFSTHDVCFDQPLSFAKASACGSFAGKNTTLFDVTVPMAVTSSVQWISPYSPLSNTDPFSQIDQSPPGFSPNGASDASESTVCPQEQYSLVQPLNISKPSLRATLNRVPTNVGIKLDEESVPKRSQRKKGRPRLDRSNPDTSTSAKCHRPSRLPHN